MSTDLKLDGLVVTIGAPGSGKSTWADTNLPDDMLRLERDRFRECLFGSRRAYHESPVPREARSRLITESMLAAMGEWPYEKWAVTDTGLRHESINPFLWASASFNADIPVTLIVFNRSWEWIDEVNQTRPEPHRINPTLLREMFDLFHCESAWWRDSDYHKIFIED